MAETFKAVKIAERVYWVGAIDWELRDFHGYLTSQGSTYNAYLVTAAKVTLVDTVKPAFHDEMMARIASVIDPARIECVVSNHSEMDHSGALPQLLHWLPRARLIASAKGKEALDRHFEWHRSIETVKTGDRLDLGDTALSFVETPMLHWPDSMFSFLEKEKVLFTNDAFGMHLATSERFADEIDPALLRHEAAKYYANILLPLSPLVRKVIDKLPSLNLDFNLIAPDHGPIWRADLERIIGYYREWAERRPTKKAVVVYDTMWRSTAKMASAVGEGLIAGGAKVAIMPLRAAHRSDVATELLDAGALVVGSPTMNNQIYPTIADAMTYLAGLKPGKLFGATFGSYGWSGEAVHHMDRILQDMKIDLVSEGLKVKYVPGQEDLAACFKLGLKVAERLQS